jgi:alkanesulfonate monooxygenase SsuD/methylene tetrahydromethanopterin reductase-like flavin-dependent oxidoreductase (luciferase family)
VVGLDSFGIGEHHRREYLDSAAPVILGAAAARTQRIRLSSAVTLLSAIDPVRLFQQFATVELLSNGRAEIVVGPGSFIEAFPLFGLRLEDYDALFEDHLDLLLALRRQEYVTWSGRFRPPSPVRGCSRDQCNSRCRSGSAWGARRSRSRAPARWAFPSWWRSSAARRGGSGH